MLGEGYCGGCRGWRRRIELVSRMFAAQPSNFASSERVIVYMKILRAAIT